MAALQLFLAPLLAGVFTLWAAWLALAAESEAELPRLFAARLEQAAAAPPRTQPPPRASRARRARRRDGGWGRRLVDVSRR